MPGESLLTAVRWRVVAVVFLLSFITIAVRVCISSAKLQMAHDLHITDVEFGWVFGVFALGYCIAMIPAGWMGDRFGPRIFLTAIVCGWAVLTIATGSVTSFASLIVFRLLFGLAEAGVYPIATKALYGWIASSERASALGFLNAGSRLGAALGLAMASYIVLWVGWRACFWLLGAVALLWAGGWYIWFRDDPAEKRGISPEELRYIQSSKATESVLAKTGGSWMQILRSASGQLLLLQYFANNFSLFVVYSWMLPYLQMRFQVPSGIAGVYAGMPIYCGVVATFAGGLTVDALFRRGYGKWSRAIPAIAGFAVASFGQTLAGFATSTSGFVFWFGVVVFGLDFTVSSSWAVCADLGREHTGVVSGGMNMAGAIGSFACALAFPYVLRSSGRTAAFFFVAATLDMVAVVCWLMLGRASRSGLGSAMRRLSKAPRERMTYISQEISKPSSS
jgi:ACS family glucarate transporter-like MFS transporter